MDFERRSRRQGPEGSSQEEVRLFLDSSVLLAASGSATGASRLLFAERHGRGWTLLTSDYCRQETVHNLGKLASAAKDDWLAIIRPALVISNTQVVLDRPLIYRAAKDRPVIISALHHQADYLLTLDRDDFHDLLGTEVYGLRIRTPGEFLRSA